MAGVWRPGRVRTRVGQQPGRRQHEQRAESYLGSLAAYGLLLRYQARRPNRAWIALLIVPRIIPTVIVALPFSLLMDRLGLDDTLMALIIAHTTVELPLAILILFAAMTELPGDRLDAARIDGCSAATVLWRIVMPSLGALLVAVGALCFAQSWNEFLYALMNVQQHAQTAPLAIAALLNKDGIEFDYVGAHLLLVTLPPLLVALLAQRFLAFGLSLGALKVQE